MWPTNQWTDTVAHRDARSKDINTSNIHISWNCHAPPTPIQNATNWRCKSLKLQLNACFGYIMTNSNYNANKLTVKIDTRLEMPQFCAPFFSPWLSAISRWLPDSQCLVNIIWSQPMFTGVWLQQGYVSFLGLAMDTGWCPWFYKRRWRFIAICQ